MVNERLMRKNEAADPGLTRRTMYDALVNQKIRARYTQSMVEAIMRKAIAGLDNGEFAEYNAFAEQCKAEARAELYIK